MATYVYVGTVLPDTTRISSPALAVRLASGPDYPSVTVTVQIWDNRVIASCDLEAELTDVACATLKNIVQDVASSICAGCAIVEGAWTVVTIDTCINPDGSLRARFGHSFDRLKRAFTKLSVIPGDIVKIYADPEGYYLRLAFQDINSGLITGKFMRSHFYRAVEALRRSVAPLSSKCDNGRSWEAFRTALGLSREQIDLFAHHSERHGDYANAVPLSAEEVDRVIDSMAEIISRYVNWFTTSRPAAHSHSNHANMVD